MTLYFILFLLTGIAASFIVGLLGLGAGLVTLPILSFIFVRIFPHALSLKVAVGTCMCTFIPIALISATRYLKTHPINKKIIYTAAPGYLIGGSLAPLIAHHIPNHQFHIIIGSLLIMLSLFIFYRAFQAKKANNSIDSISDSISEPNATPTEQKQPHWLTLITSCTAISMICGTAGVSSGILMIPFLNRYLSYLQAVTVSITGAVLYSTFTTVSYIITGLHEVPGSPSIIQLGYVYLPAALLISIPSYWFSPLGVRCSQKININILKMIFSGLVMIAGIDLFR